MTANLTNKSQPWHSLCNLHAGKQAVVVGKGPSLHGWLVAGCPRSDGAVVIAINEAAHVLHGAGVTPDFAVSNHRWEHFAEVPTQWVVSLPSPPSDFNYPSWRKPGWAAHWFLHVHGVGALKQTREVLQDSRLLCNLTSSAHPTVHFGYYLGCTSLLLVGIEEGGGYAPEVAEVYAAAPGCDEYYALAHFYTAAIASTLFRNAWNQWGHEP